MGIELFDGELLGVVCQKSCSDITGLLSRIDWYKLNKLCFIREICKPGIMVPSEINKANHI